MTAFSVTVLGNNAALPAHGRHPTSQVLVYHDRSYLLDCGEGTQIQMRLAGVRTGKLNHIFITHLHGDHYYGLIGLITSLHLNQRKKPLTIYCPKGLREIVDLQLYYSNTRLTYEIEFIEVDPALNKKVGEDAYLEFISVPMDHSIPCCGYLFREKPRTPKFIKSMLEKFGVRGIEVQKLKAGLPFKSSDNTEIPANHFMIPQPQRAFAFLGDTRFNPETATYLKGVSTIYHESTFLNADADRAADRFHSTAAQAAAVAKAADVNKLLLGHYSGKYQNPEFFASEATRVFKNSIATVELETYDIE